MHFNGNLALKKLIRHEGMEDRIASDLMLQKPISLSLPSISNPTITGKNRTAK